MRSLPRMPGPMLLCTDGSELALDALRAGVGLISPDLEPVVVTVTDDADPMLVTGTGIAGGTMSPEAYDEYQRSLREEAEARVAAARTALGLPDAAGQVLRAGAAGPAICELANELGASLIVVGTRGHGGLKRAVLGSVADHVVRNAPCTVVVGRPSAT